MASADEGVAPTALPAIRSPTSPTCSTLVVSKESRSFCGLDQRLPRLRVQDGHSVKSRELHRVTNAVFGAGA